MKFFLLTALCLLTFPAAAQQQSDLEDLKLRLMEKLESGDANLSDIMRELEMKNGPTDEASPLAAELQKHSNSSPEDTREQMWAGYFAGWKMAQCDVIYEVCRDNGVMIENYKSTFERLNADSIARSDKYLASLPQEGLAQFMAEMEKMKAPTTRQIASALKKQSVSTGVSMQDLCRETDRRAVEIVTKQNQTRDAIGASLWGD